MLDVGSMELEECRSQSHDCEYCFGFGMAKVWHPKFDGLPTMLWKRRDGTPYTKLMTSMAYCVCAAGRKIMIMHQSHSKDIFARTTDLEEVLGGRSGWVADDPTLEYFDPSEVPDWKEVLRMTAAGKSFTQQVRPKSTGNKAAAYREMAEPRHPADDARSSRRAIVEDDYGTPKAALVPSGVVNDDDSVPF